MNNSRVASSPFHPPLHEEKKLWEEIYDTTLRGGAIKNQRTQATNLFFWY